MTDGDSIAIVGCAYRLPGGIRSDTDFWRLLPGLNPVGAPSRDAGG